MKCLICESDVRDLIEKEQDLVYKSMTNTHTNLYIKKCLSSDRYQFNVSKGGSFNLFDPNEIICIDNDYFVVSYFANKMFIDKVDKKNWLFCRFFDPTLGQSRASIYR